MRLKDSTDPRDLLDLARGRLFALELALAPSDSRFSEAILWNHHEAHSAIVDMIDSVREVIDAADAQLEAKARPQPPEPLRNANGHQLAPVAGGEVDHADA